MTDFSLCQIDAFTDTVFGGNPAAVCPLDDWLPDETLQAIAAENNLSETAFFALRDDGDFDLRWFTPTQEVELCGHATLASGFLILDRLAPDLDAVTFHTRSGELSVARRDDLLYLDFPAQTGAAIDVPEALVRGLGKTPVEVFEGPNVMAVLETEGEVAELTPDFPALAELHPCGVIVTAPGEDCDFVSRFFAPSYGIPEDPVTGSAHCMLTPYWAEKLGKDALVARQISDRGGLLYCAPDGDRVAIGGQAVLFMEGVIRL